MISCLTWHMRFRRFDADDFLSSSRLSCCVQLSHQSFKTATFPVTLSRHVASRTSGRARRQRPLIERQTCRDDELASCTWKILPMPDQRPLAACRFRASYERHTSCPRSCRWISNGRKRTSRVISWPTTVPRTMPACLYPAVSVTSTHTASVHLLAKSKPAYVH